MTLPNFLSEVDGEIRLTGHRIGLYDVMRYYKEGYSAERIAEELPTLSVDQVQKVIAFYLKNRAEVDAYVADYRAELERQEAAYVPGPGALRIRRLMEALQKADLEHASDPGWSDLPIMEKLRRIGIEAPTDTR